MLGIVTTRRINILQIVSEERYKELRPNDLIHWSFIQWAIRNAFEWFDFGIVRYEGQRRFKKKWGTTLSPYRILFYDVLGKKTHLAKTWSPEILSWLWKRMIPRSVGARLGRHIRERYGR